MKLAFSSLAWSSGDDRVVASALSANGFAGVELAPTKFWRDLSNVEQSEISRCRGFWSDAGLEIVALQAILFGRKDLQLFGSDASGKSLESFLSSVVDLSASLGAGVVVLGAPANRRKGDLTAAEANDVAVPVLRRLGDYAAGTGVSLCIEPNPVDYGCDWIVSAAEGRELVERVASNGFQLHLDAGALELSKGNPPIEIAESASILRHFHISEPGLAEVGNGTTDHAAMSKSLHDVRYSGWCSVEMREPASEVAEGIARAAEFARELYG